MLVFLTEAGPNNPNRWNVGVSGMIGDKFYRRERYLLNGPWCRSVALKKAKTLRRQIAQGIVKPGCLSYA